MKIVRYLEMLKSREHGAPHQYQKGDNFSVARQILEQGEHARVLLIVGRMPRLTP